MIDIKEIELEIADIEHAKDHSPSVCMYLSALYSIRDHMNGGTPYREPIAYSQASYSREIEHPAISAKVEIAGNSEFLRSVTGKDTAAAWSIVDELMDNLKLVNPRVYDNVLMKIQAL